MVKVIIYLFSLIFLISCVDKKQLSYEYDNHDNLEKYSNNSIESGFFILPEGDFRGGGKVFSKNGASFIEARLVREGNDIFLDLPIRKRLSNHDWDFSNKAEVEFLETNNHTTTRLVKSGDWVIHLQDYAGKVKYLAKKKDKKIFSIKLPPVDKVGYRVTVGKIGSDMEIIYFQTLQYPKNISEPLMQEAVFSYVLISERSNKRKKNKGASLDLTY